VRGDHRRRERRVLVEDLVEAVMLFPGHLEVKVSGAPPPLVELSEVGLCDPGTRSKRVGGPTARISDWKRADSLGVPLPCAGKAAPPTARGLERLVRRGGRRARRKESPVTVRARPWLNRVHPYEPGRPSPNSDGSMASNESPIGTSPKVAVAVSAALNGVHRYPDPLANELRKELASQHGVHPDQILVGNGSDELIYLLAWAFLAHGGRALTRRTGSTRSAPSSLTQD